MVWIVGFFAPWACLEIVAVIVAGAIASLTLRYYWILGVIYSAEPPGIRKTVVVRENPGPLVLGS